MADWLGYAWCFRERGGGGRNAGAKIEKQGKGGNSSKSWAASPLLLPYKPYSCFDIAPTATRTRGGVWELSHFLPTCTDCFYRHEVELPNNKPSKWSLGMKGKEVAFHYEGNVWREKCGHMLLPVKAMYAAALWPQWSKVCVWGSSVRKHPHYLSYYATPADLSWKWYWSISLIPGTQGTRGFHLQLLPQNFQMEITGLDPEISSLPTMFSTTLRLFL